MRSELRSENPRRNPFIEGCALAVSEIATVFMLLGDLLASRTRTVKDTDHSEPPDVMEDVLAV
jgi:hypothetical protein